MLVGALTEEDLTAYERCAAELGHIDRPSALRLIEEMRRLRADAEKSDVPDGAGSDPFP